MARLLSRCATASPVCVMPPRAAVRNARCVKFDSIFALTLYWHHFFIADDAAGGQTAPGCAGGLLPCQSGGGVSEDAMAALAAVVAQDCVGHRCCAQSQARAHEHSGESGNRDGGSGTLVLAKNAQQAAAWRAVLLRHTSLALCCLAGGAQGRRRALTEAAGADVVLATPAALLHADVTVRGAHAAATGAFVRRLRGSEGGSAAAGMRVSVLHAIEWRRVGMHAVACACAYAAD